MLPRKYAIHVLVILLTATSFCLNAQVPVYEEPFHTPVIVNRYIRLLDVWLEPGDTTLFHVHSTPSVFVHFTSGKYAAQGQGEHWVPGQSVAGNAWYNPFSPQPTIHRVSNIDESIFHVIDVELLSPYDEAQAIPDVPLTYPLLFENEKVFAYQIGHSHLNGETLISRGPMVLALISGGPVVYHKVHMDEKTEIRAGQFLYIDPGAAYVITQEGDEYLHGVLFEIK